LAEFNIRDRTKFRGTGFSLCAFEFHQDSRNSKPHSLKHVPLDWVCHWT